MYYNSERSYYIIPKILNLFEKYKYNIIFMQFQYVLLPSALLLAKTIWGAWRGCELLQKFVFNFIIEPFIIYLIYKIQKVNVV